DRVYEIDDQRKKEKAAGVSRDVYNKKANYLHADALMHLVNGDDTFQGYVDQCRQAFTRENLFGIASYMQVDKAKVKKLEAALESRVQRRFSNFKTFQQLVEKLEFDNHDIEFLPPKNQRAFIQRVTAPVLGDHGENPGSLAEEIEGLQALQDTPLSVDHKSVKAQLDYLYKLKELVYKSSLEHLGLKESDRSLFTRFLEWLPGSDKEGDSLTGFPKDMAQYEVKASQKRQLQVYQQLMIWIDKERELVLKVANDPKASLCKKLSWNEALEFKRLGYDLDPLLTFCSEYARMPSKPVEVCGGQLNSVVRLDYTVAQKRGPAQTKRRIFKTLEPRDGSSWNDIVGK
ncbi:MAG: hypothetical protein MI749_22750, partial [Desulfovibrionales bacterium]|nr:hypothetical protein [Desulfovibrionales bacterium]